MSYQVSNAITAHSDFVLSIHLGCMPVMLELCEIAQSAIYVQLPSLVYNPFADFEIHCNAAVPCMAISLPCCLALLQVHACEAFGDCFNIANTAGPTVACNGHAE